jgi:hypothetical protein
LPISEGDTITDGTATWTVQNITNTANKDLSNLTQTGQDSFLERDFTIIYPNGGTEANPATVSAKSQYVESNPFDGYYVKCEAEIYVNGKWGATGEYSDEHAGATRKWGVGAYQYDGNIVVSTGVSGVGLGNAGLALSPVGTSPISSAPCRVKVWKIGKVANNA